MLICCEKIYHPAKQFSTGTYTLNLEIRKTVKNQYARSLLAAANQGWNGRGVGEG